MCTSRSTSSSRPATRTCSQATARRTLNRLSRLGFFPLGCLPALGRLKALDIVTMKELGDRVNLIPVIAKADTITPQEMQAFKQRVLAELEANKIVVFRPPLDDDDKETVERHKEIVVRRRGVQSRAQKRARTQTWARAWVSGRAWKCTQEGVQSLPVLGEMTCFPLLPTFSKPSMLLSLTTRVL